MEYALKICGAIVIVCVICLVIEKKEKDLSLMLTLCGCCCALLFAVSFLSPVMDFLHSLQGIADIDTQSLRILFKVVAIGLLSEVCCLICQDAGKASLGKVLQTSATILILWISLPMFTKLMELLSKILNAI